MTSDEKVRLDKWLWAARFFKTRSQARQAIDGGKVHYDGHRVKPGRIVQTGALLTLRQGFDEREVTVLKISDKRGAAAIAQTLYQETELSIERRENEHQLRKAAGVVHHGRPNKKQRRQIHRFKQINRSDN